MTSPTDVTSRRLDLAGTRSFSAPGAGPARRAALADFGMQWLGELWDEASAGRRLPGVALAAVGSLARRDGGPLSDFDLVLLHQTRALGAADLTGLADRLWYPIWDQGVKLDHSVRTVNQCRTVAAGDLSAGVGLLDIAVRRGRGGRRNAAKRTGCPGLARQGAARLPRAAGADRAAARAPGRRRLPARAGPEGGPRRAAGHHGAAGPRRRVAGRPAARAGRRGATGAARRPRRAARRHRRGHATGCSPRGPRRCAGLLGTDDADALLTDVSTAARAIAYAAGRDAAPGRPGAAGPDPARRSAAPADDPAGLRPRRAPTARWSSAPACDPADGTRCSSLRAAAVAARNNLSIAPTTLQNLAKNCPPIPTPWPAAARGAVGDLLATGPGLVSVWEGLDLAGRRREAGSPSGPPSGAGHSATPSTGTPSTGTSSRPWSAPAGCCAR